MDRYLWQRNLLVLLAIVVLSGCAAGKESFDLAQALYEKGRWEEAIAFYEKALRQDPQNKSYLNALKKAKAKAAEVHFRKAKEALRTIPEPNYPALESMILEVETAFRLSPHNKEISSLRNKLLGKKEALLGHVKALYSRGTKALQDKRWLPAVKAFQEVSHLAPGYEDTGEKLEKAKKAAAAYYYREGITLARQEEWKLAFEAFSIVRDLSPGYHDIQRLYEKARKNNHINYFIEKANSATRGHQWKRAINYLEKALDYQPDNEQVLSAIGKFKIYQARKSLADADRFLEQGKLNDAVVNYREAIKYDPDVGDDASVKSLRDELSDKLFERAGGYIRQQKWGNALIWLQKLARMNPEYGDLFRRKCLVEDQIRKRIKRSIAVFDFSSPARSPDAGRIIANKLVTFLYKNASRDLRIIERENLQSILKELQLGQTGLMDTETARKVGKMRGIDILILGDVLQFSSQLKDFPSTKTVLIQIDTKREKTKEFLEWEAKHPHASREELAQAPPAYEERPIYEKFSYKSGLTKILAFLEISYKLVDTFTGENIFTNTMSGKLVKEDTYNDGVPPGANVPFDPLELPTEIEVLNELIAEKISQLGIDILKHFQNLEVVYFQEAELLYKRREYEKAIEKYTDAIFDEKIKSISTPITKKSTEMIQKLIQNT